MKKRASGFTLIEVIITFVIVAILAAVALPSYQQYVRRAKRAEARSTMLNLAQLQERWFTSNNTYVAFTGPGGGTNPPAGWQNYSGSASNSRKYDISVTAPVGQTIATSFLISATPSNGFADPQCGTLSLSSTGVQGSSAGTLADCWGK